MHTHPTHMFPAGYPLHPLQMDEERQTRRGGHANGLDRLLEDRMRSPYLTPSHHLSPERDRLAFRRGLP